MKGITAKTINNGALKTSSSPRSRKRQLLYGEYSIRQQTLCASNFTRPFEFALKFLCQGPVSFTPATKLLTRVFVAVVFVLLLHEAKIGAWFFSMPFTAEEQRLKLRGRSECLWGSISLRHFPCQLELTTGFRQNIR